MKPKCIIHYFLFSQQRTHKRCEFCSVAFRFGLFFSFFFSLCRAAACRHLFDKFKKSHFVRCQKWCAQPRHKVSTLTLLMAKAIEHINPRSEMKNVLVFVLRVSNSTLAQHGTECVCVCLLFWPHDAANSLSIYFAQRLFASFSLLLTINRVNRMGPVAMGD